MSCRTELPGQNATVRVGNPPSRPPHRGVSPRNFNTASTSRRHPAGCRPPPARRREPTGQGGGPSTRRTRQIDGTMRVLPFAPPSHPPGASTSPLSFRNEKLGGPVVAHGGGPQRAEEDRGRLLEQRERGGAGREGALCAPTVQLTHSAPAHRRRRRLVRRRVHV